MRKGVLEFIDLAKKMPDIQFVWAGDLHLKGFQKVEKKLWNIWMNYQVMFIS